MNGSASRPSSATMNGTRCTIRPATNATSRERRSSFETTTEHLFARAALRAAASFGRRSRASAPLPVSASVYSPMMAKPSAAANRSIAARCAAMPSPERCCRCVETQRYAMTCPIDHTAYHRLPCGRSGVQSNDIAVFLLQQHSRRFVAKQTFLGKYRHARRVADLVPRTATSALRFAYRLSPEAHRATGESMNRLTASVRPMRGHRTPTFALTSAVASRPSGRLSKCRTAACKSQLDFSEGPSARIYAG